MWNHEANLQGHVEVEGISAVDESKADERRLTAVVHQTDDEVAGKKIISSYICGRIFEMLNTANTNHIESEP